MGFRHQNRTLRHAGSLQSPPCCMWMSTTCRHRLQQNLCSCRQVEHFTIYCRYSCSSWLAHPSHGRQDCHTLIAFFSNKFSCSNPLASQSKARSIGSYSSSEPFVVLNNHVAHGTKTSRPISFISIFFTPILIITSTIYITLINGFSSSYMLRTFLLRAMILLVSIGYVINYNPSRT